MKRFRVLPVALIVATSFLAQSASADWPMARHDAQRTGAATGTSNLSQPVPYWRAYLGGSVGPRGAMAVDVDGDGKAEIVFAGGGRLFARKAGNTELWQTPLINIDTLDAALDVNGDGSLDILGHSSNQEYVISAKDGHVEWAEPIGDMGTIGDVRIADLNGDGLADVYIQECGCCAVKSGKTGFAYSFGSGFGTTTPLWTAPAIACGGHAVMTVADVDGDSHPELTLGSTTKISVLNGMTGAVLATSPALGTSFVQRSECLPVNVDGQPGEELVCVLNTAVVGDNSGHRVFVLHYAAAPSPTLAVVWQHDVGQVNGGLAWGSGLVADLDGDGALEVNVSGTSTSGTIATYVYDAAGGAQLASIPGQKLLGTAKLTAPSKSVLLTSSDTTLSAWSFQRGASSPVTLLWSLPDHDVLVSPDWGRVRTTSISDQLVSVDLSGDGIDDLLTRTLGAGLTEVQAFNSSGGSATLLASEKFLPGVEPLHAWVVPPVDQSYPQVMVAASSGFMSVLDNQLTATAPPGIKLGGFYASGSWGKLDSEPVVGNLGSSTPGSTIVVTDSRGALVRLDGTDASFAAPPSKVWESLESTGPLVLQNLDGSKPGVACWKIQQPVSNPPHYQVGALRADGSSIWIVPIDQRPLRGLVPAKLNSDTTPDLLVQWGNSTDTDLQLRGISGLTGGTLWNRTITAGANRQPAGAAAFDWDGDGYDDFIYQFYGTRVASGVDGTELLSGGDPRAYAMTTVYDVDGDGTPEVTLQGSNDPATTLSHDLSTALWRGPTNRPFPYGAVASCSGQPPKLVEGSYQDPANLQITDMGGATAGNSTSLVLAGGKAYADAASATAAGASLGQLASASVHEDLGGNGQPLAVVGSADGWLYAVDPCNVQLAFSVQFDAPVGAIAFGDTDGDGLDEILASVADGYLYDLRQPPIKPPAWVIDTDPPHGKANVDVDDIVTSDQLSAKWAAVSGAESYQVAVAKADGSGYVSAPSWQDVGNVTATTMAGLSLQDGVRYTFAVKAVVNGSASADTDSDGVRVHLPSDAGLPDAGPPDSGLPDGSLVDSAPDAPLDGTPDGADGSAGAPSGAVAGGGCACRLATEEDPARPGPSSLALATLLALLWRRRRGADAR